MEQESGDETPQDQTLSSPFTPKEERKIQMRVEAKRRFRELQESAKPSFEDRTDIEPHEEPAEEEDQGNTEVLYPPTRRHILWLFSEMVSGKKVRVILLLIVLAWVVVFGGAYALFDADYVADHAATEILISVGVTVLLLVVLFILEIRTFVVWRTWKLQVTSTAIKVGHPGVGWLGIDDTQGVFKRSGGEIADVTKKWYFMLFFLNSYTVSFDSPSQMDEKFKDLAFIKNGNKLKNIFD